MYERIKDIDPDQLSEGELRPVVILLLGFIEQLMSKVDLLDKELQALRDENNKLKGGNARPQFTGSSKVSKNISSGGKEKVKKENKNKSPKDKTTALESDEVVIVEFDKNQLPPDAVFKGYKQYNQQDIEIKRCNKYFLFETWHSPSMGKTFRASWPEDRFPGHYGLGVRSLLSVLRHLADVTEGTLHKLMKSFGIEICAGTISNLLKAEHDWAMKERNSIFIAGLGNDTPKQMDTTSTKQKGCNTATHIITDPFFTVFYTTATKSRLDCLNVLQGCPEEGIKLLWYEGIKELLLQAKLGATHPESLKRLMKDNPCLTLTQFDALMQREAPQIFKRKKVMCTMREEMALAYYKQQQTFLPIKKLVSDGAPEYPKIAPCHSLCWIHDARHYNILSPKIAWNAKKLEDLKDKYWAFYRKLADYTQKTKEEQQQSKEQLEKDFDSLFVTGTQYPDLDKAIERTRASKKQLLAVLEFPDLPLHNNEAELAARRVVRKRDISLHTWSDWGTQLRDAFMSIIQTAIRLNISPYQYICDRISRNCQMDSLASIIARSNQFTPAL